MLTIYALKLENEKYYIGKTHRQVGADIRFQEHKSGIGSEWTRLYKPISILETYEHDSAFEEDVFTKKYMMKYGIEHVRGGSYTKIVLDEWQIKSLEHEFKTANDSCFKCGKKGHFADDCKKNNINKYLSSFETEEELDAEIIKNTELRLNLRITKSKIDQLKYIKYKWNEGSEGKRQIVDKVIIIEPKMIDEYEFRDYKFVKNTSFQNNDKQRVLLYQHILPLLRMPDFNHTYILEENVIENIYKIYIERIKIEKILKKYLEENSLSLTNYMEELNMRIEYLYEKYSNIILIENIKNVKL
jgi:predicted GIY-YIG superfamily endonuclease